MVWIIFEGTTDRITAQLVIAQPPNEPAASLRKNRGDTLLAVDVISVGQQHDAVLCHKV